MKLIPFRMMDNLQPKSIMVINPDHMLKMKSRINWGMQLVTLMLQIQGTRLLSLTAPCLDSHLLFVPCLGNHLAIMTFQGNHLSLLTSLPYLDTLKIPPS